MVVVSVTVGSIWLHDFDTNLNETQVALSDLKVLADTRSRQHILAVRRAETADVMAGLAVGTVRDGNRPDSFLLGRAGMSLSGAIKAMWVSTPGSENIEALSSTVEDLRAKLNGGDLAAYDELTKIFADQGIRSNDAMRAFSKDIAKYEARLKALRLRIERVREWQATLNIIGLVIVLLKDLPVWGRGHRAR